MDFYEVINKRRSSRKFTDKKVPEEVMRRCFEAAVKAPNSSNLQTWRFWWVKDQEKEKKA